MVRLKAAYFAPGFDFCGYFNSNMVRLKAFLVRKVSANFGYFNSNMVRLKGNDRRCLW